MKRVTFRSACPMNMPGARHHRDQMTSYSCGLIGFTGFVGGTLMRDRAFDAAYNSVNIADINGCSFERLVCAGVPAAKWQANRDPKADRTAIARLTGPLLGAKSREFILIS